MERSSQKMKEHELNEGLIGSATAILVHLQNDEMSIANIGDCAIMVLRNNAVIYRSEEQQHWFNFPFQLGTGSQIKPKKDAQVHKMKLKESDMVIIGSDGIWDNLFDSQVVKIVKTVMGDSKSKKVSHEEI
jgi:serine/threonine protein phosphatase PrpC